MKAKASVRAVLGPAVYWNQMSIIACNYYTCSVTHVLTALKRCQPTAASKPFNSSYRPPVLCFGGGP